jgi:hypothetical protein
VFAATGDVFNTGNGSYAAYGGGTWVAVGSIGRMLYSINNGESWSVCTGDIIDQIGYSVAYGGSRWVAVGTGNYKVVYSDNGINWIGATRPAGFNGRSVVYANGRFVAVGENSVSTAQTIVYSVDGQTFTAATGDTLTGTGASLGYGGGRWVAASNTSGGVVVAYSSNGETWTAGTGLPTNFTPSTVAYGNGTWVIVGEAPGGGNHMFYSLTGGETWQVCNGAIGIGNIVGYGGNKWVAILSTDTIIHSTDGITWTTATGLTPTPIPSGYYALAYGDGKWLATSYSSTNILQSSNGGVSWSVIPTSVGINGLFMTYANNRWIVVTSSALAYVTQS